MILRQAGSLRWHPTMEPRLLASLLRAMDLIAQQSKKPTRMSNEFTGSDSISGVAIHPRKQNSENKKGYNHETGNNASCNAKKNYQF
jgi:hypothetical protein